jgi:hypothetical protein
MERRDIVIGILILVAVAAAIFLLRRNPSIPQIADNTPNQTPTAEQKFENSFKTDIPDDVEKVELKDVANIKATALATRKWESNRFTATVMADLPDPAPTDGFYQAWIQKDDTVVSLGRMRLAKGGWIVEYQGSTNYSDYKNVLITQEKFADNKPETHLLEGSF